MGDFYDEMIEGVFRELRVRSNIQTFDRSKNPARALAVRDSLHL